MLVCGIFPASMVGDDFEPVGDGAPCLFGGLQPVSFGKLFFGLGYQTFTVYAVALYGDFRNRHERVFSPILDRLQSYQN